jgi:hypothetical protein
VIIGRCDYRKLKMGKGNYEPGMQCLGVEQGKEVDYFLEPPESNTALKTP